MLVNHFQSDWRLLPPVEKVVDPLCRRLGWRTDLSLKDLLAPFNVSNVPPTHSVFQIVLIHKSPRGLRVVPAQVPDFSRSPVARGA